MSAASDYTENNVINSLLRGVVFPVPSKTYVSLHTANPTDAGGAEVTTTAFPAYVRREAEQGGAIGTGWTAPSNGVTNNAKQLVYPGFNGPSPITVTHWAVYESATGGNILFYAALATPRQLQTGDVFVFDVNSLTVTMA